MRNESPRPKLTLDDLFSDEPLSKNLYATVEQDGTCVELHLTPGYKMDSLEDMLDIAAGMRALPQFLQSPVCRNVRTIMLTSWIVTALERDASGVALLERFGFEVIHGPGDQAQRASMERYQETMAESHYAEFIPAEYRNVPPGHARMKESVFAALRNKTLDAAAAASNAEIATAYARLHGPAKKD